MFRRPERAFSPGPFKREVQDIKSASGFIVFGIPVSPDSSHNQTNGRCIYENFAGKAPGRNAQEACITCPNLYL